MVAPLLTKSLLLLALGFSQQVAAACTRTVKAKQGDTCASIASAAGITVTDFLRSNPSVTSCSSLVVGGTYCVQGTDDSTSSAAPQSSTPPGLQVSVDGTCGSGITCAGSRFGDCCSAHGYCGSTSDYCSDGCQAAFGNCGGGAASSSPGSPAGSITVTVTSTRTSVVTQTSTVVQTQTAATATATVTQTVKTTATVPITATITSTSIFRLTSIITSVSTQTVKLTSVSIDTLTSIVTSTSVVTSGACGTVPSKTTGKPTTTSPPAGRPTLPGTPSYCRNYDQIESGDTCRSIASRNNLSLLDFYSLNPSINCDALWEGYYVCVGR